MNFVFVSRSRPYTLGPHVSLCGKLPLNALPIISVAMDIKWPLSLSLTHSHSLLSPFLSPFHLPLTLSRSLHLSLSLLSLYPPSLHHLFLSLCVSLTLTLSLSLLSPLCLRLSHTNTALGVKPQPLWESDTLHCFTPHVSPRLPKVTTVTLGCIKQVCCCV